MRINSRSGIGGGTRIVLPSVPVVEEPVINEVEGIEEVIEDDEDESIDGGVG